MISNNHKYLGKFITSGLGPSIKTLIIDKDHRNDAVFPKVRRQPRELGKNKVAPSPFQKLFNRQKPQSILQMDL